MDNDGCEQQQQHLRINLRRLLNCCHSMVAPSTERTLDRELLQTFLADARGMVTQLLESSKGTSARVEAVVSETLAEVAQLEAHVKRESPAELRRLLLSPSPKGSGLQACLSSVGSIPPRTAGEAAARQHHHSVDSKSSSLSSPSSVLHSRRGTKEARLRGLQVRYIAVTMCAPFPYPYSMESHLQCTVPVESASNPSALTTVGSSGSADQVVITELEDIVRVFRSKAVSMGEALKMDVKAIEDTEFLVQKNLSRLASGNALLALLAAGEWRQAVVFTTLLVLSTLLFLLMLLVILWYRAR